MRGVGVGEQVRSIRPSRPASWAASGLAFVMAWSLVGALTGHSRASAATVDGLGARGPCESTHQKFPNPLWGAPRTHLFLPEGEADAPVGGSCGDGSRPAVVFVHGYSASFPEVYAGLIDHLVSMGFAVLYPTYQLAYDPERQYAQVEAGTRDAAGRTGRLDLSRLGVAGHSFGGGMAPWLTQRVADWGWGGEALWIVAMMPHFSMQTGSGPIEIPAHARAVVIAGERDRFVDHRIGMEIFHALGIGYERKAHVTYLNDWSFAPKLGGNHVTPLTIPLLLPENEYDSQGIWRLLDAVSLCSLRDVHCDADLGDLGTKQGRPIRRALVTDDPVDLNHGSLQECEFFLNPRPCPAPGRPAEDP